MPARARTAPARLPGSRRTIGGLLVALALVLPGVQVLPAAHARAATAELPFDLPSTGSLRSSAKLVFAHYFPPLPISLDNLPAASDYYTRNYLSPGGEKGKNAASGGLLRDRPLPRAVLPDPGWRLADMRTEVRQAISAGIDGFTLDLLALPGDGNAQLVTNAQLLLAAAHAVDPDFKVMLMPDLTGSQSGKSAELLADGVAALAAAPSAYHLPDGRLVVAPVKAEAHSAGWWSSFMDAMAEAHGVRTALFPVFIGNEQTYAPAFAPISYGMSIWGSRNPGYNDPSVDHGTSARGRAAKIKALGVKWMQPVSVQDERPNQGIYDEAENTTNLRDTWQLARATDADFVQIPTWNDYSEGTQLAPSLEHGWTYLDISSYYITWFKTGSPPAVARDAIYLTHRTQRASARPVYPQARLMTLRGGSPSRDTVEALTFLTTPGRLVINVGATNYVCAAQAGVDVCTVPLGYGRVSAWVERGGTVVAGVTSPYLVTPAPFVQDLQYVGVSSLRTPSSGGNGVTATSVVRVDRTVDTAPSADTYANAGAPGTSFGSTSSLSSRGTTAAESYLRFDVPAAPAGTRLTSAALTFHTTDQGSAGSGDAQSVYLAGNGWDEDSLTWRDRPDRGVYLGGLTTDTSSDRRYAVPLALSAASSFPGSERTLTVQSTGGDELRFWSRDYAAVRQRPGLLLTYSPVF